MDDLVPQDREKLAVGQTIRVFAPLVERAVDEDASGNAVTAATATKRVMMSIAPRGPAMLGKRSGPADMMEHAAESEVHHIRKLFREACATILVHEESDDADDAVMEHMVAQCHPGQEHQ
jgi:hypothetical protein